MFFNIMISSAVDLAEKDSAKEALRLINYNLTHKVYDCREWPTFYNNPPKQAEINEIILKSDWFICLFPENTIGEKTWEELELAIKSQLAGHPIVISVFHPLKTPENGCKPDNNKLTYKEVKSRVNELYKINYDQYEVNYEYGNKDNLKFTIIEEHNKLQKKNAFGFKSLRYLSRKGHDIQAPDLYFNKQRAESINGFIKDKYYPRESVDKKLHDALEEKRKFTIILGAPGSGKTRAILQQLSDSDKLTIPDDKREYLGYLKDKDTIIINEDNIRDVFDRLQLEKADNQKAHKELYLVCDQIRDVFSLFTREEDLYNFFDTIVQLDHIRMIATSIPSAYRNFRERWKDYGHKPFEDSNATQTITIPPISYDREQAVLRNWIQQEINKETQGETIGDFIPQLKEYKEGIVKKLYEKNDEHSLLSTFLSAIQTTETYRHDHALFIPILIARTNSSSSKTDFNREIVETINFLIANNVIWITKEENNCIRVIQQMDVKRDFNNFHALDKNEDRYFDGEKYEDTPITTAYLYTINEIVWNEIVQQDAYRHLYNKDTGNYQPTLLENFQDENGVKLSYVNFYNAFPDVTTLRRILPRIPRTDCYDEATKAAWEFVYNKCMELNNNDTNKLEPFLLTIGLLISHANDIESINKGIKIIEEKGLKADYGIVGELYSAGARLGIDVTNTVVEIRNKYELQVNNFFSLTKEILYKKLTFDEAISRIEETTFAVATTDGNKKLKLKEYNPEVALKSESHGLEMLFTLLANKSENTKHWETLLNLHETTKTRLRRSLIRNYFSTISETNNRTLNETNQKNPQNTIQEHLTTLLEKYSGIINEEDLMSCYFHAADSSTNFEQAYSIYNLFLNKYNSDNQILVSIILRKVQRYEFQKALNSLIEIDNRLKESGSELNHICFNNLIKKAPNMGEAMDVIPYLSHIQDHTLANILKIIKYRSKTDFKAFYYAYFAAMQNKFLPHRKSPYIIGLLFDLSITLKHEQFIRDTYLKNLDDNEKKQLIDYSTSICSIRIKKQYRSLDEVWTIFNICRNHYKNDEKPLYINSDIYSNMMQAITDRCTNDEESLNSNRNKLRLIINEDFPRIIRDKYFFQMLYRFFPEKNIVDENGNICEEFKADMEKSSITDIEIFNNLMSKIMDKGFDTLMNFYQYIVLYYQKHGKWSELKPSIRTVTVLMESVLLEEQYNRAISIAGTWCSPSSLKDNKKYNEAYRKASVRIGKKDEIEESNAEKSQGSKWKSSDITIDTINSYIKQYGSLTPSLLNQYLKQVIGTVTKNKKTKKKTYEKLSKWIDENNDKLSFDSLSYTCLLKLSPCKKESDKWIGILSSKKEIYQFDLVVCSAVAQHQYADISVSREFYTYWETIIKEVGYDPDKATDDSNKKDYKNSTTETDAGGYWTTQDLHTIVEMKHYASMKENGQKDDESLTFIATQMEFYNKYERTFPTLRNSNLDFTEEIHKLQSSRSS